jgi:hypothetical protein
VEGEQAGSGRACTVVGLLLHCTVRTGWQRAHLDHPLQRLLSSVPRHSKDAHRACRQAALAVSATIEPNSWLKQPVWIHFS